MNILWKETVSNEKIKIKFINITVINKKVGTNWVALNEELSTYIDEFNFNIIKKIEPIKFIDEIRQSPYYFYYFGSYFYYYCYCFL